MKKTLCLLLACLLLVCTLGACSKTAPETADEPQTNNFAPETTAVSGGLTQAVEEVQDAQAAPTDESSTYAGNEPASDLSADSDAQQTAVDATLAPSESAAPTAQPVNNSHTSIDGYTTIGNVGLGFSFSYPINWNNLPGRSTVCYVQPISSDIVYPARVAVTMKKLSHRCTDAKLKTQFASYFTYISSQYDEETFEANMSLNGKTQFMGNKALSTTYLAYDGDQEIMGYAICTYFERYVFVFHFLCAYEDYEGFKPAMEFMRDSVKCELELDD